jgi:hypothetical protein
MVNDTLNSTDTLILIHGTRGTYDGDGRMMLDDGSIVTVHERTCDVAGIPCAGRPHDLLESHQLSTPTIAPMRHVASVPDTIDFSPSETMSSRRSGAMVAMPPIMIPSEPKLAKPHIA